MVRDTAHGNRVAALLVARGERDFKLARSRDGVFKEQLVEIAQPEQQQRARDLLFCGLVLPHQRRGSFGWSHGSPKPVADADFMDELVRRTFGPHGSRVQATLANRTSDAVEGQHIGGGAVVHAVLLGISAQRR